mgnify:CR=1 FL=1
MNTQVVSTISQPESGTSLGAEIIRAGGLVAFPTETVYGLGANGLNAQAVRGIYVAKGRPSDNPSILHVGKKSDVRRLWRRMPRLAQQLMDTFWPGPLTLIAQRSEIVPDEVTGGLDTVAVRMPADRTARMLIQKAGVPVAAPSANLSSQTSPVTASPVIDAFYGAIDAILDGGKTAIGTPSTILSLAGERPELIRAGALPESELKALLGL